jgi:hypothetical protein
VRLCTPAAWPSCCRKLVFADEALESLVTVALILSEIATGSLLQTSEHRKFRHEARFARASLRRSATMKAIAAIGEGCFRVGVLWDVARLSNVAFDELEVAAKLPPGGTYQTVLQLYSTQSLPDAASVQLTVAAAAAGGTVWLLEPVTVANEVWLASS